MSSVQVAEINLYEIGLYNGFFSNGEKMDRISILHSCLITVKRFFEAHFNPSSSFSASIAYHKWIQTGYVLLVGFKLCICTAEAWDLQYARDTLDFSEHIGHLIRKLEFEVPIRVQTKMSVENGIPDSEIFSR